MPALIDLVVEGGLLFALILILNDLIPYVLKVQGIYDPMEEI